MIRPAGPADRSAIVAINEANQPDVGPMDDAKYELLVAEAVDTAVVEVDGAVVGFHVLLGPGGSYASPNYRWFCDRYDDFVYVDRIAIDADHRGAGWGPALYDRAVQRAGERGAPVLVAEVNTIPPNPRSLRFHRLNGFVELERVRPYDPDTEVVMLARPLDGQAVDER